MAPLIKGSTKLLDPPRRANISLPPLVFHHVTQTAARVTSISPALRTSQNLCLQALYISCPEISVIHSTANGSHSSKISRGNTGKESTKARKRTACSERGSSLTAVFGNGGKGSVDAVLIRVRNVSSNIEDKRGSDADILNGGDAIWTKVLTAMRNCLEERFCGKD